MLLDGVGVAVGETATGGLELPAGLNAPTPKPTPATIAASAITATTANTHGEFQWNLPHRVATPIEIFSAPIVSPRHS